MNEQTANAINVLGDDKKPAAEDASGVSVHND